jgi:hypothetical protein
LVKSLIQIGQHISIICIQVKKLCKPSLIDPVIENLQNHGDNLEVARNIDHWIYFKNEVDLNKFVEIILSWDFQINQKIK